MDILQNYACTSSSDSGSESDRDDTNEEHESLNSDFFSLNSNCPTDDETVTKCTVTGLHLQPQEAQSQIENDSKHRTSTSCDAEPRYKKLKVDNHKLTDMKSGETFDVPNTAFWSSHPLVTNSYNDMFCQNVSMQTQKTSKVEQLETCKYKQEASDNFATHSCLLDRTTYRIAKTHSPKQQVQIIPKIPHSRKLFVVHGTIKPFLHQKSTVNRIPTKCFKKECRQSVALNRIKWNIPMYSHLLLSASMDTNLCVWNFWTDADSCVCRIKCHNKAVRDADWSLCGRKILSCSYDKTACISDIEQGHKESVMNHNSFVTCGKYHPEQPSLLFTGEQNLLNMWDLRCPSVPQKKFLFKDMIGQVQDISINPYKGEIFSCSDFISKDSSDRNIIAWDIASGAPVSNQIYQERYSCTRLQIHHESNQFLAQSQGGYIAIFSLNRPYKMNKSKRFEGHKVEGYGLGFSISTDGQTIYSASADGKVYCYNFNNGKLYRTINAEFDVCMDVAAHPVLPSVLASCGWNGNIQIWS